MATSPTTAQHIPIEWTEYTWGWSGTVEVTVIEFVLAILSWVLFLHPEICLVCVLVLRFQGSSLFYSYIRTFPPRTFLPSLRCAFRLEDFTIRARSEPSKTLLFGLLVYLFHGHLNFNLPLNITRRRSTPTWNRTGLSAPIRKINKQVQALRVSQNQGYGSVY